MIMERQQTASDLINERNLKPQTLLEDYLSVTVDLRRCSLMTVPAEFPDAEAVARTIDLACISDYRKLVQEPDMKKRAKAIEGFKRKLRDVYREKMGVSSSYRSHVMWTDRLDLQIFEVEVRPTVRELYIYRDKDVKSRLEALSASRASFRERFLRTVHQPLSRSALVYPEEYFPEYVLGIGELLGYPKCCTEAYIEGRTKGNVSAEERASRQIRTGRAQGYAPEPYAYFVRDFIPCVPTCASAIAVGQRFFEEFGRFDSRLSEYYGQCLKANVANVESYIETIAAHKEKMKTQAQELGIQGLR